MSKGLLTITVARKPLSEGSVARNVLKWGTGGMNIDAGRIGVTSADSAAMERCNTPGSGRLHSGGGLLNSAFERSSSSGPLDTSSGRWPANVILQHKPGCKILGTRHETTTLFNYMESAGNYAFYLDRHNAKPDLSELEVHQEVEVWDCEEGCPCRVLDEQVGVLKSGSVKPEYSKNSSEQPSRGGFEGGYGDIPLTGYGDIGGASRYFKQVQTEQDLVTYLTNLIGAPGRPGLFWRTPDAYLAVTPPNSLPGLLTQGEPSQKVAKALYEALAPGAHLLLMAPEERPTGHRGAIAIEDAGFEIRDAILLVREGGRFHYVGKATRGEREAGCEHLKGKTGAQAVERQEGTAGLDSPRAGAGRAAAQVKNFHPCLHPDALVMTEEGYRPISEVSPGQKVYGQDGCFHPVGDVSQHPYTSEFLYEIAVQGTNYTTRASDNHPFLIWRPRRKGKSIIGGDVLWTEAQDILKGDYTMTPILAGPGVDDVRSHEWWWVFGLWLAEGVHQRAGHGSNVYPSFSLHQDETHLVERLRCFFEGRGFTIGVYPKSGKGIQVIGFDPEVGAQFQTWSPCGAANKQLPRSVWIRSRPFWEAVFEGYMAGDGGIVRSWRQAKTVSPDLASQMRLLGEALGCKANLFHYDAAPGKVGNRMFKTTLPSYQIRFYNRDRNQTSRKPARPATISYEGVEYRLSYVQRVTPVPYTGNVWNLTVPDNLTFQTAVGMSHNTVKPIGLMERLLHDMPMEDEVVVDPFVGSGATGIACLRTGHNFVGIDLGLPYLEIADARLRYWEEQQEQGVGRPYVSISSPFDGRIPVTDDFDFVSFLGGLGDE